MITLDAVSITASKDVTDEVLNAFGLSDLIFIRSKFLPEHAQRLQAMPYGQFLQTRYWQEVHDAVIALAFGRCECGNAATQVHHKTYAHHGYEHAFLGDLIAVCGLCHCREHSISGDVRHVSNIVGRVLGAY